MADIAVVDFENPNQLKPVAMNLYLMIYTNPNKLAIVVEEDILR